MQKQETTGYSFSFGSSKTPESIFKTLLDVKRWWFGLYGEEITGKTKNLQDEFTFSAGGGVHYSKQKLVELVPNKKIAWLVTASNLNFLKDTNEWTGTTICFEIAETGGETKVTFKHLGLVPEIECYGSCSTAWTLYLQNLEKELK